MELNSKKLERTSRIVYYSISTILCLFLILLSNRIIDDLDSTITRPYPEDFEDKTLLQSVAGDLEMHDAILEELYSKKETVEKTIETAQNNYTVANESFDNWLQARKTLGTPDKDREVVDRAHRLDELRKVEQQWRQQRDTLQQQIDHTENLKNEIQQTVSSRQAEAYARYETALKRYELKVFLIRLIFVAPVLALGIFFVVRYRRHRYYPLYFGFTLFSFYAFFFGLVPYLPSYGGYVRYSVGVLLSVGLGWYAIRRIRLFIEQKQAELKISTQERAKSIQTATAEKALENHFCPSCGKDFFLYKWEFPSAQAADSGTYKSVTTFCRHCGMELFKNCNNCGTRNFVHLPFCSSCGTKVTIDK